jgi:hypothetical protein
VPELLITNQPSKAVTRPLAVIGAGAFLCDGAKVGSHAGDVVAAGTLRRPHGTSASIVSPAVATVRGGYQPNSRIQFDQMTQAAPVNPGASGPYPAREPEPV